MHARRFAALALPLAVALALPLAGCRPELPSAETIAAKMAAAQAAHPRVHTTSVTTFTMHLGADAADAFGIVQRSESWTDGPDRMRTTMEIEALPVAGEASSFLDGLMASIGRGVIVRNGDTIYTSFEGQPFYMEQRVDDPLSATNGASLFSGSTEALVSALGERFDLRYAGDETVAGRKAHKVAATPKATAVAPAPGGADPLAPEALLDAIRTVTIWADAETWTPLRFDVGLEVAGQGSGSEPLRMEGSTVVMDYDLDAPPPPEGFVFEPPAGAKKLDLGALSALGDALPDMGDTAERKKADDVPAVAALADAGAHVDFPVRFLDPVPDGCTAGDVTWHDLLSFEHDPDVYVGAAFACLDGDVTVLQGPADAEMFLSVFEMHSQMAEAMGTPTAVTDTVTLGGANVARTTVGSYRRLAWDDGGTHFEVSGEVPDAVLEAFAAGLGR